MASVVDNVNVTDSVGNTEASVKFSSVDSFENWKSTVDTPTGSPFEFTPGRIFDCKLSKRARTVCSTNVIESNDLCGLSYHLLTNKPTNILKVAQAEWDLQQYGSKQAFVCRCFEALRRDLDIGPNFKNSVDFKSLLISSKLREH